MGVSAIAPGAVTALADPPLHGVLTVRAPAAQRMLGIGETTFWRLVRAGEIPVVRVGTNLTLVPLTGLRDFLARHTVATGPPDALPSRRSPSNAA